MSSDFQFPTDETTVPKPPAGIALPPSAIAATPLPESVPATALGTPSVQYFVDLNRIVHFRSHGLFGKRVTASGPNVSRPTAQSPLSIVQQYDSSGQAGYGLVTSYDDMEANITAYATGTVTLNDPGAGTGSMFDQGNILVNTIHGGEDSGTDTTNCLESGIA